MIEIAAVKSRRRDQGRIAETAEVIDVLLSALVEHSTAQTDRGLAVAEWIPGYPQARRPVVLAVLHAAQRQIIRPLLNHPVVRVAGAGENRAIGHAGRRVDLHRLAAVIQLRLEVILKELSTRVSGTFKRPANPVFHSQAAVDLPAILRVSLGGEEAECSKVDAAGLRDAGVIAQQHICKLVAGIVRIAGVGPEVDIERIAPAGLLPVVVKVVVDAGLESVRAAIVCQVIGPGVSLALAAPVGLERREIAGTDTAAETGKAVADVLIGIQLLELEAERRPIVRALVCSGHDIDDLRQVVIGEDELIRGRR